VTLEVTSRRQLKIDCEDDVVVVRRAVRAVAEQRGFDTFACAAITTATSELTRNVWVHARKGHAVLEEVTDGFRYGLRIVFEDQGPGIPDVDRVLAGGFSTAKSMGLGLSGSKRLADAFVIETTVGRGTRIEIVKWKSF
jgi:serine/threonine-protein kinase RsbT